MRISLFALLISAVTGCGGGAPDVSTVKENMTSDQLALSDPIVNSVGMVLVPVPAGEFQMGTAVNLEPAEKRFEKLLQIPDVQKKLESGETSKEDLMNYAREQAKKDRNRKDEPDKPQHPVTISKSYYIGVCEVTQQQFEKVMGASPWKGKPLIEEGPDYAATYITWEDAVEFCRKLSEMESVEYRLPTEAEWEYACRAETTTAYSFGDDGQMLGEHAWYDENAYKADEQYAHLVGQKLPNSWAVYDMHGNAWEWCQDWYARYDGKAKEQADPTGPEKGRFRVWRGGSFAEARVNMRSASRLSYNRQGYRPEYLAGFRVVREFNTTD